LYFTVDSVSWRNSSDEAGKTAHVLFEAGRIIFFEFLFFTKMDGAVRGSWAILTDTEAVQKLSKLLLEFSFLLYWLPFFFF
jgi:hypothetical protein